MRTHYCGTLTSAHIDQEVTLYGWVDRRRDHGGVIFLDMRDREGIVQVVFDPDTEEHFERADKVRGEYVLQIKGRVRARAEATVNPNMTTGEIEVLGKELEILNSAATPPFQLDEHIAVGEDIRLKYRFIDLRRPEMLEKLKLRSRITNSIRRYLDNNGFLDIETPILTKATPEGARDYLVPSRTHEGKFFALPQSPQLFKQLLMVSGMDRYYQIAKCFRDEDLRAAGLSGQKMRYARALAEAQIDYPALRALPSDQVIKTLTQVTGIGQWTAEIYAMFSLGRADVFAHGDLALQEAARILHDLPERPKEKQMRIIAADWTPWRSVAARILWAYYRVATSNKGISD